MVLSVSECSVEVSSLSMICVEAPSSEESSDASAGEVSSASCTSSAVSPDSSVVSEEVACSSSCCSTTSDELSSISSSISFSNSSFVNVSTLACLPRGLLFAIVRFSLKLPSFPCSNSAHHCNNRLRKCVVRQWFWCISSPLANKYVTTTSRHVRVVSFQPLET